MSQDKTGLLLDSETADIIGEEVEVTSFKVFSLMVDAIDVTLGAVILIEGQLIPGGTWHPIHKINIQVNGSYPVFWDDFPLSAMRAEIDEYIDGEYIVEYSLGYK